MLRSSLGLRQAAPVLEYDVTLPDHPGETFHLFGVDPFAEGPFRPHLADIDASGGERGDASEPLAMVTHLVARPSTALMSSATARRLDLRQGDTLRIRVAGTTRPITLIGWIEPADRLSARALESLLVTDIATAQELAGARGRLTRIDLIAPDDADGRALIQRIRDALPPDAEIVPAGARAETAASMTAAFTLNLTALSLLALVVGMFLIYNTMTFSVVQRRALIGMLRALGVTRSEVFTLVMVEALAVGIAGTAAGLLLGTALAHGLLGLVTRTINDLYFVVSVREISITRAARLRGSVLLGVGATLVAALAPAAEASGARPREALSRARLESRAQRMAPRAATGGGALILAGTAASPRAGCRSRMGIRGTVRAPPGRSAGHPGRGRPASSHDAGAGRPSLRPPRADGGPRHRGRAVPHRRGHRGADDRDLGHHRRGHHDRELPRGGGGLACRIIAGGHLHRAAQPDREPAGRDAGPRARAPARRRPPAWPAPARRGAVWSTAQGARCGSWRSGSRRGVRPGSSSARAGQTWSGPRSRTAP